MTRNFVSMRLALAAATAASIALGSSAASATVIDFSKASACTGGCDDNSLINPTYGSTATVDVTYSNHFDAQTSTNQLQWWGPWYSNLEGVAFGSDRDEVGWAEITFTPKPGYSVTLQGFDLGAWGPFLGLETSLTFLNGSIAGTTQTPTISTYLSSHFAPLLTSTESITIQWGPSAYNVGIDNIEFSSSPVSATPLPAALPLMLSGLSGLGLLAFRRKQKRLAA